MTPDPDASKRLSDRIVQACEEHQRTAHQLARLLAELVDGGHLRALGYASLAEYADTVLGLEPRTARDLLRIGRALPELPGIEAEMAAGRLPWTKVRELVRVATSETEAAWLERASVRSSRALEREVTHVGRGEPPPTNEEIAREPMRRRVVFDMEAADAEVVFRMLAVLRARSGLDAAEAEDGALLAAVAHRVIHEAEEEEEEGSHSTAPAPGEAGAGDARRGGDGGNFADGRDHAGADGAGAAGVAASRAPSGERYRVVLVQCPSCGDAHALAHGGRAEVSDTIAAEAACDAELVEMRPGPEQGHRTRSIPPATRRIVLHQAGWRCEVPGCRGSLWLDIHHLRAWSRGGGHEVANLAAVCSMHHRAIHAGALALERLETGAIRVEHHDGRVRVGAIPPGARPSAANLAAIQRTAACHGAHPVGPGAGGPHGRGAAT